MNNINFAQWFYNHCAFLLYKIGKSGENYEKRKAEAK